MKFVLFVEGELESKAVPAFLKRWLDPKLKSPVRITPINLRGSGNYLKEIQNKVALNLSGASGAEVIAAIGLLDLYGLEHPPDRQSAADRYTRWKTQIERSVNNPRFRQFFAVHETEAWLLADKKRLPREVGSALPKTCVNPESVDFGEPPAKLLRRLYREKLRTEYQKVVDSTNLLGDANSNVVAKKCPYLQQVLDEMRKLAQKAGL